MNALSTPLRIPPSSHARRRACAQVHRGLARFAQLRLRPTHAARNCRDDLEQEIEQRVLENRFVEQERARVRPWLEDLPTDPQGFLSWFEQLARTGPGQGDPLFPWLSTQADMEEMRWFLAQEIAGEAGLEDLVALTQVRFPERPKLEMASNYWDEMGRGHAAGMHGTMLARTAEILGLKPCLEDVVWEALALANLMVALAANRAYAYLSVGALGVVEMTAPARVARVNEGLRRLGVCPPGRMHFPLHAGLDLRHSEAWNREVIGPLVAVDPAAARPIAEGALMRLNAGARCFERYRQELECAAVGNEACGSTRLQ